MPICNTLSDGVLPKKSTNCKIFHCFDFQSDHFY